MNIVVISDVHANYQALHLLDSELKNADVVLCLGDIVGYHTEVNEVIDYLRDLKHLICIMGNHDDFLIRGTPSHISSAVKHWIDYANQVITKDNFQWLSELPMSWSGFLDQVSFMIVHGSPWKPFTDYLYADNALLKELDVFQYDVIAFGQTHRYYIRSDKKPYLINPGSVGQPRDKKNIVSALKIDTKTMNMQRIERALLL